MLSFTVVVHWRSLPFHLLCGACCTTFTAEHLWCVCLPRKRSHFQRPLCCRRLQRYCTQLGPLSHTLCGLRKLNNGFFISYLFCCSSFSSFSCFHFDRQFLVGQYAALAAIPFAFAPNRALFQKLVERIPPLTQGSLSSWLALSASAGSILGPIYMGLSLRTLPKLGDNNSNNFAKNLFIPLWGIPHLRASFVVLKFVFIWSVQGYVGLRCCSPPELGTLLTLRHIRLTKRWC